jgi:hypothetical protein
MGMRRGSLSSLTGRPRGAIESDAQLQRETKLYLDTILSRYTVPRAPRFQLKFTSRLAV